MGPCLMDPGDTPGPAQVSVPFAAGGHAISPCLVSPASFLPHPISRVVPPVSTECSPTSNAARPGIDLGLR